jgi:hypothetical protein
MFGIHRIITGLRTARFGQGGILPPEPPAREYHSLDPVPGRAPRRSRGAHPKGRGGSAKGGQGVPDSLREPRGRSPLAC